MKTILIVDDEKNIREGLKRALKPAGFKVILAEDGQDGYDKFMTSSVDLAILDIRLPKIDGITLFEKIKATEVSPPVIFITGHGSVETAVKAMQLGAFDFLIKPINLDQLESLIHRALEFKELTESNKSLTTRVKEFEIEKLLLGRSRTFKTVIEKIKQVAKSKANIYIYGESGTGKELVCDAIHKLYGETTPLVKVNCAALSPNLIESELFGHEKGSFTGALEQKIGRFEAANGGTLFLDEVSEIPKEAQVKLLRVLQERKIERVGSSHPIDIDVRIIAASNKPLEQEVKNGNFREDLFYRLNVIDISLPPLRERKGDIEFIAKNYLEQIAYENGKNLPDVTSAVFTAFNNYRWPGNIRELRNVIEKIIILSKSDKITLKDLPAEFREITVSSETIEIPYGTTMEEAELKIIQETIVYCGGNKSRAAQLLGIGRKTLHRKLGLDIDEE